MKLPKAHFPTASVSPAVLIMSRAFAAVIIICVVIQLMTYEKFVPLVQNYQFLNDPAFGKVFAALIVIVEVMSLPFLLRMRLSPLMRFLSAGCLIAACLAWVILSIGAGRSLPANDGAVLAGFFDAMLLSVSLFVIWLLRHDFKA